MQAVLVNIGGTMFSISSIPNILITTYAKITFLEFFLNVGIISIIIFGLTLIFFIFLYKKELKIPKGGAEILREFNVWNFVPNKTLLIECIISLSILFILFVLIPATIVTPDIIALSIAIILIIISKVDPKEIISKLDFELILYLLGIFVIAGALEVTGVTDTLGSLLFSFGSHDLLIQTLLILWISAFLSSSIDNIPITKVLIPVIDNIPSQNTGSSKNLAFYSLAIGANWGDNLTPLGDNILVVNVAEQNKRPISFKSFFKLGFITTIYQLALVSLIFVLLFNFYMGLLILFFIIISLLIIYLAHKFGPNAIRNRIDKIINKFRDLIIK